MTFEKIAQPSKGWHILKNYTVKDLIFFLAIQQNASIEEKAVIDAYNSLRVYLGLNTHDFYNRDITVLSARFKDSMFIVKKIRQDVENGVPIEGHVLVKQLKRYGFTYNFSQASHSRDFKDLETVGHLNLMGKIDQIRSTFQLLSPYEYSCLHFQNLVRLLRELFGYAVNEDSTIYDFLFYLRAFDKHLNNELSRYQRNYKTA